MCTYYITIFAHRLVAQVSIVKCLGDLKWMDTTNNNIKLGRGVLLKLIPKRKCVY